MSKSVPSLQTYRGLLLDFSSHTLYIPLHEIRKKSTIATTTTTKTVERSMHDNLPWYWISVVLCAMWSFVICRKQVFIIIIIKCLLLLFLYFFVFFFLLVCLWKLIFFSICVLSCCLASYSSIILVEKEVRHVLIKSYALEIRWYESFFV